ncbi:DUF4232 domain-containing protein [Streptomyces tropicalis]|uniref:DUF4232 domain-containing protein n=1 Tax=Streptomyces tropicalis TaxID=3034234 RepID=A0ABT6A412_9ACTN|nr:DUF4232 domain-containing protein [Streptomyces tropicalis]MDF3299197.1 DUF4232 domain-containing protein [Streptomyces tropicalis]
MQYAHRIRGAALAAAAAAAVLSVTACGPADATGTAAPTASGPSAPTTGSHGTPGPAAASSPAGTPAGGASATRTGTSRGASSGGARTAGTGTPGGSGAATVRACAAGDLRATARQAVHRPSGTGVGAAVVRFVNHSARPCRLQGYPSVAGAGNGSPQRGIPLKVTRTGAATPVRLAPGGSAWLKLTFVQVQGEGDGYCVSGAKPSAFPTLVIGLPGSGAHQVALDDGVFAECDNKVTATAVTSVKPS